MKLYYFEVNGMNLYFIKFLDEFVFRFLHLKKK